MTRASYPPSVREQVTASLRLGIPVKKIVEEFGIGTTTVYHWARAMEGETLPRITRAPHGVRDRVFARFREGATVREVARELKVNPAQVYRYREDYDREEGGKPGTFTEAAPAERCEPALPADPPTGGGSAKDLLITRLKLALADKTMEADFFIGALQKVKAQRQAST